MSILLRHVQDQTEHVYSQIYFMNSSLHIHTTFSFFYNYINPGSQIPQVEARKRCTRDLFTSSGRATALIDRHFWHTFVQQSMTRLTSTAILLTYTSRFHWGFPGNWQEHICERNIRCFGSPGHLSLGSDPLYVTVCRTCTVPLWDVQRTVGSWKNILGWLALPQGLNCRPGPCECVAGAMSASLVACKIVWFIVKQRQLHASPPANELSWLLENFFRVR